MKLCKQRLANDNIRITAARIYIYIYIPGPDRQEKAAPFSAQQVQHPERNLSWQTRK